MQQPQSLEQKLPTKRLINPIKPKQAKLANTLTTNLKNYYLKDPAIANIHYLVIESPVPLSIENRYVNLAIVSENEQTKPEQENTSPNSNNINIHNMLPDVASLFSEIFPPESLTENKYPYKTTIHLKDLFDKLQTPENKILEEHVFIEGGAGSGKTTLCQFILNRWAAGDIKRLGMWVSYFECIFFIPLRALSQCAAEANDLYEFIYFQVSSYIKMEKEEFIEQLIHYEKRNKVLFLLDDFSDVAHLWNEKSAMDKYGSSLTGRAKLLRSLLAKKFWILTSRSTLLLNERIQYHKHLITMGFDDKQLYDYIGVFFDQFKNNIKRNALINALIDELKLNNKQWLKELMRIPINAELICTIYQMNPESAKLKNFFLPLTKVYQNLFIYLFERFLKEKCQIDVTQINPSNYETNSNCSWVPFIEALAWQLVQKLTASFKLTDYTQLINEYFPKDIILDFKKIFDDFGIFKKMGITTTNPYEQVYEFSHKTFQEFFAAKFLAKNFDKYSHYISKKKFDANYFLIWQFLPGLLELKLIKRYFDILLGPPRSLLKIWELLLAIRYWNETNHDEELADIGNHADFIQREIEYFLEEFFDFVRNKKDKINLISLLVVSSLKEYRIIHKQKWFEAILDNILSKYGDSMYEILIQFYNFINNKTFKIFKIDLNSKLCVNTRLTIEPWTAFQGYFKFYNFFELNEQKEFLERLIRHLKLFARFELINSWHVQASVKDILEVYGYLQQESIILSLIELSKNKDLFEPIFDLITTDNLEYILYEEIGIWKILLPQQKMVLANNLLEFLFDSPDDKIFNISKAFGLIFWGSISPNSWGRLEKKDSVKAVIWKDVWGCFNEQQKLIIINELEKYCIYLYSREETYYDSTKLLVNDEMWKHIHQDKRREIADRILEFYEKNLNYDQDDKDKVEKDNRKWQFYDNLKYILFQAPLFQHENIDRLFNLFISFLRVKKHSISSYGFDSLYLFRKWIVIQQTANFVPSLPSRLFSYLNSSNDVNTQIDITELLFFYDLYEDTLPLIGHQPVIWHQLEKIQQEKVIAHLQSVYSSLINNDNVRFNAIKLFFDRFLAKKDSAWFYKVLSWTEIKQLYNEEKKGWITLWDDLDENKKSNIVKQILYLWSNYWKVRKRELNIASLARLLVKYMGKYLSVIEQDEIVAGINSLLFTEDTVKNYLEPNESLQILNACLENVPEKFFDKQRKIVDKVLILLSTHSYLYQEDFLGIVNAIDSQEKNYLANQLLNLILDKNGIFGKNSNLSTYEFEKNQDLAVNSFLNLLKSVEKIKENNLNKFISLINADHIKFSYKIIIANFLIENTANSSTRNELLHAIIYATASELKKSNNQAFVYNKNNFIEILKLVIKKEKFDILNAEQINIIIDMFFYLLSDFISLSDDEFKNEIDSLLTELWLKFRNQQDKKIQLLIKFFYCILKGPDYLISQNLDVVLRSAKLSSEEWIFLIRKYPKKFLLDFEKLELWKNFSLRVFFEIIFQSENLENIKQKFFTFLKFRLAFEAPLIFWNEEKLFWFNAWLVLEEMPLSQNLYNKLIKKLNQDVDLNISELLSLTENNILQADLKKNKPKQEIIKDNLAKQHFSFHFNQTAHLSVLNQVNEILRALGSSNEDTKKLPNSNIFINRREIAFSINDLDNFYSADLINLLLYVFVSGNNKVKIYPATSLEALKMDCEDIKNQTEEFASVAINVAYDEENTSLRNHWVALIVDKKNSLIFYLDPAQKTNNNFPQQVIDFKTTLGFKGNFILNTIDFQQQEKAAGWIRHCGAYVVEIFKVFLKYLHEGKTISGSVYADPKIPNSYSLETVLSNIPCGEAEAIQKIRLEHIEAIHQMLVVDSQSSFQQEPKTAPISTVALLKNPTVNSPLAMVKNAAVPLTQTKPTKQEDQQQEEEQTYDLN